ncbi:RNA polymerase sigma factor [Pedobacter nototheniae]|uniref:RNA polymerase sigma factor n=1 Tax=Pedobacter nototheniae TaxID=2488994 RepID=UPI00103C7B9B|nr:MULTISPECIES: sigma-70 family RNA polymerase sigma factor [Pedobacter]
MRDGYLIKSDEDLMSLLSGEDSLALETLFNRYYPALCKFTSIYLNDYSKAEELIADLFMKLWDKKGALQIKTLKQYLFVSARNLALNEIQRVKLNTFSLSDHDESFILPDTHLNPHDLLASRESYKEIFSLINHLPDRQREVLLMSRVDLLEKNNIADILGISVRTVETLLYQAIKNFRLLVANANQRSKT